MSQKRLYLVRHGEALTVDGEGRICNQSEADLTEKGIKQAEALADVLKNVSFLRAYSSDLKRARRTAEIVVGPHGLDVLEDPDLREFSIGDMEGMYYPDALNTFRDMLKPGSISEDDTFPGGESLRDLHRRVTRALERIINDINESSILIAAHGGVNRVILAEYLGLPLNRCLWISQDNACLNLVDFIGGRPLIRLMNWSPLDPTKVHTQIDPFARIIMTGEVPWES